MCSNDHMRVVAEALKGGAWLCRPRSCQTVVNRCTQSGNGGGGVLFRKDGGARYDDVCAWSGESRCGEAREGQVERRES